MSNKLSPMMKYYLSLKEEYKNEIIFFRLGDFYEMFFDDAIKASSILGLTLTGRDCGLDERAPMCGVPFHAADGYIAKLISAGEKVAVCEQLTQPNGKGLVERGVVKVVTAGTVTDSNSLNEKACNYLMSIYKADNKVGLSWTDITTGELTSMECDDDMSSVDAIISSVMPTEIITTEEGCVYVNNLPSIKYKKINKAFAYNDYKFRYEIALPIITSILKVQSMHVYECEDIKSIISSLGGLCGYLSDTQMHSLKQINDLNIIKKNNFMFLDSNTRRNLELTENARDSKRVGSLIWVLDKTKTCMGARELKKWIDRPLILSSKINDRLDAVEELIDNNALRANVIDALKLIRDIERLACKIPNNNCSPRDLLSLGDSLQKLPLLKELLSYSNSKLLRIIYDKIDCNEAICELICNTIVDKDTPATTREGGYIKDSVNQELSNLRHAKQGGTTLVASIEAAEKERTGIKTLRIKHNRVFGYYIEIPKSAIDKVPFNYTRKQTTANTERYITEELKAVENTVLTAEDKANEIEFEIFNKLKEAILLKVSTIQTTSTAVAALDVLQSFAELSRASGFVKPTINDNVAIHNIVKGRHPVVEKAIGRNYYTPNDSYIDTKSNRTMIITGPNMSGKSTYMRQVAIIVLMAHLGCFVPCDSAEIALTDRIFTRIGASDDLMSGQSTFMVEMVEVATILKNCTDKSLLILDEIGRGTSTCDGLSIAWAVVEYISSKFNCKTLFSTHYHELTQLENILDGVKNFKVSVSELNGEVVFTHKITRGGADKSFGIEVAAIAGIPCTVIERAKEIVKRLEVDNGAKDINSIILSNKQNKIDAVQQVSFLTNSINDEIIAKLKSCNTEAMTPMQALIELDNLKQLLRKNVK